MVNVREILPKQTEPVRVSYDRKHDPPTTCGYHAKNVGNSIEDCYSFKTKVRELIDRSLLCFTPVTANAPIEKRFEYKGPLIHVQVPPLAMQYPNQGYHPRILLAYPRASCSTTVAPQYAYAGDTLCPIWGSSWSNFSSDS